MKLAKYYVILYNVFVFRYDVALFVLCCLQSPCSIFATTVSAKNNTHKSELQNSVFLSKTRKIIGNYMKFLINNNKISKDLESRCKEEYLEIVEYFLNLLNNKIPDLKKKSINQFDAKEKLLFYVWIIFSIFDGCKQNVEYLPYSDYSQFDLLESILLLHLLYKKTNETDDNDEEIWNCFPNKKGTGEKFFANKIKIKTFNPKVCMKLWIKFDGLQDIADCVADQQNLEFKIEDLYAFN